MLSLCAFYPADRPLLPRGRFSVIDYPEDYPPLPSVAPRIRPHAPPAAPIPVPAAAPSSLRSPIPRLAAALASLSPKKLAATEEEEPCLDKIKAFSPEKSHPNAEALRPSLFDDDFHAALRGESFAAASAAPITVRAAPPDEHAAGGLQMPTAEELAELPLFGDEGDSFTAGPAILNAAPVPTAAAAAAAVPRPIMPSEELEPAFRQFYLFPPEAPAPPAEAMQYPLAVTATRQQEKEFAVFKNIMKTHCDREDVVYILAAEFGLVPPPFYLHAINPDGSLRFGVKPFNFSVDSPPVPTLGGDHLSPGYIFKVLIELGRAKASLNTYAILYQVRECLNYINYGTFKSVFEVPFPRGAPLATGLKDHVKVARNEVIGYFYGNGSPITDSIIDNARVVAAHIKALRS